MPADVPRSERQLLSIKLNVSFFDTCRRMVEGRPTTSSHRYSGVSRGEEFDNHYFLINKE